MDYNKLLKIYFGIIILPYVVGCVLYAPYYLLQYFLSQKTHALLIIANVVPWLVFMGTIVAYALLPHLVLIGMMAATQAMVLALVSESWCCQKHILHYCYNPNKDVSPTLCKTYDDQKTNEKKLALNRGPRPWYQTTEYEFHEVWYNRTPSFYHWFSKQHDYKKHAYLAICNILPGYLALGSALLVSLSMLHSMPTIVLFYTSMALLSAAVLMQAMTRIERMYHAVQTCLNQPLIYLS
jgi:hypothetical protein